MSDCTYGHEAALRRIAELEAENEMLRATVPPVGSVVYPPGALDKHEQRVAELEVALTEHRILCMGMAGTLTRVLDGDLSTVQTMLGLVRTAALAKGGK
jgi:hypothetical protein